MKYTLIYKNTSKPSENTEVNSNDYDTIQHYFMALMAEKVRGLPADVDVYEITLYSNETWAHPNAPLETTKRTVKYHFAKS